MIHPDTRIVWISDEKGYGLFTTAFIPKGTITFARDLFDIAIDPSDPFVTDPVYGEVVEKYSYIDRSGKHVITWDHGKFVNHCCDSNSVLTGYGFEIATRDIANGEELTDDYGLYTLEHDMRIVCTKPYCRKRISIDDFDQLVEKWDTKIIAALAFYKRVEQPLAKVLDLEVSSELAGYLAGRAAYRSVRLQKPQRVKI
jgi:hypothetical protein